MSGAEERLAQTLWEARCAGRTIPPLDFGTLDVEAAYRIQAMNLRRAGGRRAGRKIGLTSEAIQRQLNVDQPDVGVLTADMDMSGAAVIDINRLVQPRIEAEVAFILDSQVPPGADAETLRGCIAYATAAAEIVDSVIDGWRITLFDTVADNASAGLFALGTRKMALSAFDPADVTMRMTRFGEVVSEGTGAACLGDPLNALAWLARAAEAQGEPLRAGEVILSGALGPMVWVRPGDVFEIAVEPLGALQVAFSD